MSETRKLIELYNKTSKHSQYQVLPEVLKNVLGDKGNLAVHSRFERERLAYILRNFDVCNKSVFDIGGNTGFFTFEMLSAGAKHVTYCEGNRSHADFVETSANILGLQGKLKIMAEYFDFNRDDFPAHDLCLCLNILHHLGDDFGDTSIDRESAKQLMLRYLNNIASYSDTLVFQLGFNHKGDKNQGLFDKGTKDEMIDFVKSGIDNFWNIEKVGVATKIDGIVTFADLNEQNRTRQDELGEFLNRPIFIMKSKLRMNI